MFLVKRNTTSAIVRTIWQNSMISRVLLAKKLNLDKSTITIQMKYLLSIGLVKEVAEGKASLSGGRKPIHLEINPSFATAIGIEVNSDSYMASSVNFLGEKIGSIKVRKNIRNSNFANCFAEIINESIDKLISKDSGQLLGVGLGISGLTERKSGKIKYSVPLAIFENFDFEKEVASKFNFPCYIENDANCCAWGEINSHNRKNSVYSFIFLLIREFNDTSSIKNHGGIGLGFGISIDGEVYIGKNGIAGEFRSVFCNDSGCSISSSK